MKKGLKLVTIGGGSSYTPELVEGMIKRIKDGRLDVREFWLVDVEEGSEKLRIVSELARRMVKKAGVDLPIYTSLNRREAIVGADFITTQFRVGFLEARINDERRAYHYGLIGQETNGVGGFSKALRTIPVILEICKDIEEICPDAWMVNFANPSGMVTEAVLRYTRVKCIGVCNKAFLYKTFAAEVLGCSYQDITLDLAGLNHFFFIKGIAYQGEDRFREVFDIYKTNANEKIAKIQKSRMPVALMDAMQAIPNPYLEYYFLKDETFDSFKHDADTVGTRGEVVRQLEHDLFQKYESQFLDEKPEELSKRGGAFYSDVALDVIDGIANDRHNIQYVNILNHGTIPELPEDASIEVSCEVSSQGATPVFHHTLNMMETAMICLQKSFERLTIECAKEGDYDKGLMALTMNPLIFDAKKAEAVYVDILQGNAAYLPEFQWYFK